MIWEKILKYFYFYQFVGCERTTFSINIMLIVVSKSGDKQLETYCGRSFPLKDSRNLPTFSILLIRLIKCIYNSTRLYKRIYIAVIYFAGIYALIEGYKLLL